MELTKKDRLNLINQFKILSFLNPKESDYYDELIEILEYGYEVFYSQIEDWVFDEMPTDEGKLVLDVLSLYRAIEDYKIKNPKNKIKDHSWGFFVGFDGNNETSYMSFARFLIHKQKKFSEQLEYIKKNDNCNSHMQTLYKYKKMLDKWNSFESKFDLSEEEIFQIIEA